MAELTEKERDKEMLEKAIAYEKALQDLEDKEKVERRLEGIELQKYLQQQKSDKAQYEKMID